MSICKALDDARDELRAMGVTSSGMMCALARANLAKEVVLRDATIVEMPIQKRIEALSERVVSLESRLDILGGGKSE